MADLDAPSRPACPVFKPADIPRELRVLPRWVCWSYVWSARKKKWDKPPRRPDGTFASSTDPTTWYAFGRAVAAAGSGRRLFDGVGFVLVGDGLTAVDLDDCIPDGRVTGVRAGELDDVDDWARAIVVELDSYTEVSPSARGIRIFVRGSLPQGCGNRGERFEVYDRARYVTVTGDHVAGSPRTIQQRQSELERLVARMLVPAPAASSWSDAAEASSPDDDELLERARAAKNGHRFEALFDRGELAPFANDHSRADLALCSMLAFWCGNAGRVDRLFRRSALYRPKWDERHNRSGETYGQMTLTRALRVR